MSYDFKNGWALLYPEEIILLSQSYQRPGYKKEKSPSGFTWAVYGVLKHHAWSKKDDWWISYPSMETICEELEWEVNKTNLKRVLDAVAELNHIDILDYKKGDGGPYARGKASANEYDLKLYRQVRERKGPPIKSNGKGKTPTHRVGNTQGSPNTHPQVGQLPHPQVGQLPHPQVGPSINTNNNNKSLPLKENEREQSKPNKRKERERKQAERNNPRANDTELWKTWKTLFWGEADGNIPDFTSRTKTSKTRMKGMMMEFGDAEWKKYEEMMEVIWGMDVPIDQNTKNFLEEYGRE
jgi:hypothetical protein